MSDFDSEVRDGEELAKVLAELDKIKRENYYLRMRVRCLESNRGKGKISKWSKVKGALGWEKEKEDGFTLKVPQSPSDPSSSFSISPAGSCLSQTSLTASFEPAPLSSSSSSEDEIHVKIGRRCASSTNDEFAKSDDARRSKSLDAEAASTIEQHMASKMDQMDHKKSNSKESVNKMHKTPWSKVKGIIHPIKGARKRSYQEEKWPESKIDLEDDETAPLLTPKLTVTVPSSEELTVQEPDNVSPSKLESVDTSPGLPRKSRWFKVRNVFLQGSRSAPTSPVCSTVFTYDVESDISSGDIVEEKDDVFQDQDNIRYEIEASYAELQNRLTDEFAQKMETLTERRRAELKEVNKEAELTPDFKKKLEEWDKMKTKGRDWDGDKDRKKKEKSVGKTSRKRSKIQHREERLKKLRVSGRQEVLIPTSTGTFRFEGISDKFTRKLFEWEQARGITPEESTFALLDPEYQPNFRRNDPTSEHGIIRSKSIGSVADLGATQLIAHQPSSLSLNDVEDLHQPQPNDVEKGNARGPRETPEIAYAPEELTRLIDSSSSNSDKENSLFRNRIVDSSYRLLQDNITLLDKLKKEREMCRQLERDMKQLEGQIHNVSKSFVQGGDEYREDYGYDTSHCCNLRDQCIGMSPVNEFTVKLQDFTKVETTLFDDESTQTYNVPYREFTGYEREEQVMVVQGIIGEILDLADRLELAVVERDREMVHIKEELYAKELSNCNCRCGYDSYSSFTLPSHWLKGRRSQELSRIPKMLTEKVLELKEAFSLVSSSTGGLSPMPRALQRSLAQEDLSPDFRPSSRASSSASSFSFHHSNQEWARFEQPCTMVTEQVLTESFTDLVSDGTSDSGRVNANVFVPTTRKIFSPVSEFEAIGVVIDERRGEEEKPELPSRRAQSSSPVTEKLPPKFSSTCTLPRIENGVVDRTEIPFVEELPLGEELASSLKLRALKIQKAKEEFLGGSRREGSLSVVVEDLASKPTSLLVKSASASLVPESGTPPEYSKTTRTCSLVALLKLKKKRDGAVAALARQSIIATADPSQTKSCPSSPVLSKKSEPSWIRNPAKMLFRPRGKYTINNK